MIFQAYDFLTLQWYESNVHSGETGWAKLCCSAVLKRMEVKTVQNGVTFDKHVS